MIAGRAIGRRGKVRVAKSPAPSAGREPARAVLIQVEQQIIRARIKDLSSDGHAHDCVSSFAAGSVAAFAVQAAAGDVLGVVAQVQERVHRLVGDDPDIATAPAIAPRRAAARHKLFPAKGSHTVTAVAAADANLGAINEHLKSKMRAR